jgi:hypothetical protein
MTIRKNFIICNAPSEIETSLKEVAQASIAEGSYAERLGSDKNGDLWIRRFLINHQKNARSWSIDKNTSMQKVKNAFNKPITIFRDALSKKVDHPPWNPLKSQSANFADQEKYKIG